MEIWYKTPPKPASETWNLSARGRQKEMKTGIFEGGEAQERGELLPDAEEYIHAYHAISCPCCLTSH